MLLPLPSPYPLPFHLHLHSTLVHPPPSHTKLPFHPSFLIARELPLSRPFKFRAQSKQPQTRCSPKLMSYYKSSSRLLSLNGRYHVCLQSLLGWHKIPLHCTSALTTTCPRIWRASVQNLILVTHKGWHRNTSRYLKQKL